MNGLWWQIPAALALAGSPIVAAELHKRHGETIDRLVGCAISLGVAVYLIWLANHIGGWLMVAALPAILIAFVIFALTWGFVRGMLRAGRKENIRAKDVLVILPKIFKLMLIESRNKVLRRAPG